MKDTSILNKIQLFKLFLQLFLFTMVTCIIVILVSPLFYSNGADFFETFFNAQTLFSIRFSLFCSVISTGIATLCSLLVAYAISRFTTRLKSFFNLIFSLPVVLPPIVLGLSLLILLGPMFGSNLREIGLNFVYTPLGVITAQFFIALPIMIRLFVNIFDRVPLSIFEAGQIDGASESIILTALILPMCSGEILSGVTLGFARAMGEFGATMMLAGIVSDRTVTLSSAIYLNIATGDLNHAIAAATVLIFVSVLSLGTLTALSSKESIDYL